MVAPAATASSTSSLTISYCSTDTIGPTSVSNSTGLPSLSFLAAATTPWVNCSATSLWTYARSMPAQVWPAFANEPHAQPATACSTLASSRTIIGSLPPSSSTLPLSRSALATPTRRPTSTEPVKKILAALDSTSALPTRPPPCTVRTSPSGTPARSNTHWMRWPISGVSEAGLSTTPLPHISAIATSPNGIDHG